MVERKKEKKNEAEKLEVHENGSVILLNFKILSGFNA